MNRLKFCLLVSILCAVVASGSPARAEAQSDNSSAADSNKPTPKDVGEEGKLLLSKVTGDFENTILSYALEMMTMLMKPPVAILISPTVADAPVTLKFKDTTLAEALRQIRKQAGADYRVVNGAIRIGLPDELTAIDNGNAKFVSVAADGKWVLDGKSYTKDEFAKAQPDEYKRFHSDPPDSAKARNDIQTTTVAGSTTVNYQGKTYTEEEFQKQFPELFVSVAAATAQTKNIQSVTVGDKSYTWDEFLKAYPDGKVKDQKVSVQFKSEK